MNKHLSVIAAALVIASCGGNQHKADDPLTDSGRTQRTENLLSNLRAIGDSSVYMVGHEDATVCGIGWQADYTADSTVHRRSDVQSICNDYPALLGFDLGHIENDDSLNIDSVPFSRIRQEVIAHYDQGGMVTLSWTVTPQSVNPDAISRVAAFLNTLETPYGVRVPVLFRLRGATDKSVWQQALKGLRESSVTNALYVYSQTLAADGGESQYMTSYPGDDLIDIMGLDSYCMAADGDTAQVATFAAQLDRQLTMLCDVARRHGKAAAVTETGYEGVKAKDWWTRTLAPVLASHPVSYVLLWRNAHQTPGHYYAPYPGQHSVSDFIRFYNDPHTLFLHDINGLYLTTVSKTSSVEKG
jgi:mannan endo-1,4-beta-mannosidase